MRQCYTSTFVYLYLYLLICRGHNNYGIYKKRAKPDGTRFYYLEHSVRKGSKVGKKTVYLGKKIPSNIDDAKQNFSGLAYKDHYDDLEIIKRNYVKEIKGIPKSSLIKSREVFATRFTYDTQRIEGSTLSLRDTANLLERGVTPKNKPIGDIKEELKS